MSAVAPLEFPLLSLFAAPATSAADGAREKALDYPGALVLAAVRAGVALPRIVSAVSEVVLSAAHAAVDPDSVTRGADAADRVAGVVAWRGGLPCPAHADTWEALHSGLATVAHSDHAGRAGRELCRAVVDDEKALVSGALTDEAEQSLCEAVWCAAKVVGPEAAMDRFCETIPWSEIASAAAEVEA